MFLFVELVEAGPGRDSALKSEGFKRAERLAKKKAYEKALKAYDDYIAAKEKEMANAIATRGGTLQVQAVSMVGGGGVVPAPAMAPGPSVPFGGGGSVMPLVIQSIPAPPEPPAPPVIELPEPSTSVQVPKEIKEVQKNARIEYVKEKPTPEPTPEPKPEPEPEPESEEDEEDEEDEEAPKK